MFWSKPRGEIEIAPCYQEVLPYPQLVYPPSKNWIAQNVQSQGMHVKEQWLGAPNDLQVF